MPCPSFRYSLWTSFKTYFHVQIFMKTLFSIILDLLSSWGALRAPWRLWPAALFFCTLLMKTPSPCSDPPRTLKPSWPSPLMTVSLTISPADRHTLSGQLSALHSESLHLLHLSQPPSVSLSPVRDDELIPEQLRSLNSLRHRDRHPSKHPPLMIRTKTLVVQA